jgi:glycosyltransferase involved in cell wall biosynthesis
MGHEAILLTWMPRGVLHENFVAAGGSAYSSGVKGRNIFFFIRQIRFLISFCRQQQINIVISNGQGCAVVAGVAKYFIAARTVYERHNTSLYGELIKNSFKDRMLNWLANSLSPRFIAISGKVKEQLLKENIAITRIHQINLCYYPALYNSDNAGKESEIKYLYKADLILLYIARLVQRKRHELAFEATKQLVAEGIDCKLVCIGDGESRNELQQWITENNMQDKIILTGHVTNVFDYIKASDMVLLLSVSEASSHIVKEAAFCNKTILVCRGVGDFQDIIVPGYNGFLVDREDPVEETVGIIRNIAKDKTVLTRLADNLLKTVNEHFSIESVKEDYKTLFEKLTGKE